MKNPRLVILILFLSSFINTTYAAEENQKTRLLIEDAWIAEAPPVSKVMVAYMTLNNTGTETITIIHAESDLYSSIEFHETIHKNGMARMIRHDNLTIPANNKLELKRGGAHLMLFNPRKRLKTGDTVTIKLTTRSNKIKTITVPVKKALYK
ncbi:copper chaperone PCu(A)C [Cardiobacterium sp. AH-315-I02]|nr:copper chaperone PCu(A)C [Cardiobacterium sp. AH-315-I02]